MDAAIVSAVAQNMPKYNEYLLRNFTVEQINQAPEFIATAFAEAVKLFQGVLRYVGYRILSPEERVEFELSRSGANITVSELILCEYQFSFQNRIFTTYLYLPYMHNDTITIRDTKYSIQRAITETVFSRTNDGITAKVLRSPLRFSRTRAIRMESEIDDWSRTEFITTTDIHRKRRTNRRDSIDTTILHYLLCKFGYMGALSRFLIDPEDLKFVADIGNDTETHNYFAAKKKTKSVDIYLRVKRELLEDPVAIKVIANLLYILTSYRRHTIEDLYEPTGTVWRIMLGKIIHTNVTDAQSKSHMDTHISSVDTYLDPDTQRRMATFGVRVSDIYDLLQYVFVELDRIMVNSTHSNLYNKRIDVVDSILVDTIVKVIFNKFYWAERDPKRLNDKSIAQILRFSPVMIGKIYESKIVTSSPSVYGDNWLASCGIGKVRRSGISSASLTPQAPEHRFHPSAAVVESLVSFSKQSPGIAGSINPFLEITPDGGIIRPDYADEIDGILKYLPYR